jgi:putative SOS response-associated peptidase YedK
MIDLLANSIASEILSPEGTTHPAMGMPHHRMVMHAYGYHTRAWVGLTKEEKQQWIDALPEIYESKHLMRLLDIMEARLKEANI